MLAADRTLLLDRIAALEAENANLREALAQRETERNNALKDAKLATKYEDLLRSHQLLKNDFKDCCASLKRSKKRAEAAKRVVHQWKDFYDHQERKLKARGLAEQSALVARPSSPDVQPHDLDRTPKPNGAHNAGAPSKASPTGPAHHVRANEPTNDEPVPAQALEGAVPCGSGAVAPDDQDNKDGSTEALAVKSERVPSSQATEDGPDDALAHNGLASSDDAPQFVSARPVKRRRGYSPRTTNNETQIKQERTSPSQPQEIRSEDYSSPVLKRRQILRRETSNLDAVLLQPLVPQGRRGRRALSAEAVRLPRMPTMTSSLSDSGLPDLPRERSDRELVDEPSNSSDRAIKPEGSDISERALQPLSANARSGSKRKRNDGWAKSRAAKAAIVSEDGDMDSSQVNAQEPKTAFKAAIGRRLDDLLDGSTNPSRQQIARRAMLEPRRPDQLPEHILAPVTSKAQSPKRPRVDKAKANPATPDLPAKRPSAANTGARRHAPNRAPSPPEPEDEPLRARPFIRLRMDDFKINPKFQGTNFAFADTLRGRDQRRCLPGCTKPECCGDAFRKAAEMGIRGSKTDDEALEAYLGPAYSVHLASMTAEEKEDALLKARTFALASEHGRHRQAFKRHTTPPGFWRIDMPTTQEEEQDREEAVELGRREAYERWREAMQPGGRWMFRDE